MLPTLVSKEDGIATSAKFVEGKTEAGNCLTITQRVGDGNGRIASDSVSLTQEDIQAVLDYAEANGMKFVLGDR